ncbi:hypothetical protein VNO80_18729 [Phaseolus coccineus]|uniref:Uncharacterized protein n=1 Tax=Phaseolus coccineus TaxID=3886 RepID=A0AAN9QWQ1_PHACN
MDTGSQYSVLMGVAFGEPSRKTSNTGCNFVYDIAQRRTKTSLKNKADLLHKRKQGLLPSLRSFPLSTESFPGSGALLL